MLKPMVKWPGGKSGELAVIFQHMPSFTGRYVEPFCGGGAAFFALKPQHAIVNDINSKLINFYQSVRDNYETIRRELEELQETYRKNSPEENEKLYYRLRDAYNGLQESDLHEATIFFFLNKTAFGGVNRSNKQGLFNVSYGNLKRFNISNVTRAHSQLLQQATILNEDYQTVFNMTTADDFIFLDPPYDDTFTNYGNGTSWNETDHHQLAESLRKLQAKWMMIINKTPLTGELYEDLIVDEYGKKYDLNCDDRARKQATHLLITNYQTSQIRLF